jgi:hypothetical protein
MPKIYQEPHNHGFTPVMDNLTLLKSKGCLLPVGRARIQHGGGKALMVWRVWPELWFKAEAGKGPVKRLYMTADWWA